MTAPTGAGAQVARLLALVPYVLTRRELDVDEAARLLGVTPRQVVGDLKVLMFCGWPGYLPGDYIEVDLDALEGDGVIRVTNADYLARPLRLTVEEASALIVALRTLRESADAEVVEVVDRALGKLEAAAEDGAAAAERVEIQVGQRDVDLARRRADLDAAVGSGRRVRLTYYVPARDEAGVRDVDPLAVISSVGSTYLDAWCHRADARRLFRLDRIEDFQVLDEAADVHDDVAPRDLAAGLFQPGADAVTATLRLAPRARWVAEYYPTLRTEETGDGSLEVDLAVNDPRWLQRLVLRLAPDATLLGPPEFTEASDAAARSALGLYR